MNGGKVTRGSQKGAREIRVGCAKLTQVREIRAPDGTSNVSYLTKKTEHL
jgi:hypothetical protein